MRIFVKARPGVGEDKVEKTDEEHFVVSVREPPVKGLANKAIIKAVADYFGVSQLNVSIVAGHTSRQKVIIIT